MHIANDILRLVVLFGIIASSCVVFRLTIDAKRCAFNNRIKTLLSAVIEEQCIHLNVSEPQYS
jgi:hypothetical protein